MIYGQDKFRPAGCVLDIPFSGSAIQRAGNPLDISGNQNSGITYGRPTLSFDGTNDYLKVTTPFDTVGGKSVFVYVGHVSSTVISPWLYYESWNGTADARIIVGISSSKFKVWVYTTDSAAAVTFTTSADVPDRTNFHHYMAVGDIGNNLCSIYIDGELFESGAFSDIPSQSTFDSAIPTYQRVGGLYKSFYSASRQAEVGILGTNTAPTVADAKACFKNSTKWLMDNADLVYLCNEGIGSAKTIDYSGNEHHGTITGASWEHDQAAGGQTWSKVRCQINDSTWTTPTTDTTFVVDDGDFFTGGDIIRVRSELMLVESVSTNTLTVERSYQGTTAETLADNDDVYIVGDRFSNEGMAFTEIMSSATRTSHVSIADSVELDLTTKLTIACSFIRTNGGFACMVAKRNGTTAQNGFYFAGTSSYLRLAVGYLGGSENIVYMGSFVNGQKYFSAVTFDAGTVNFYVDGVFVQTSSGHNTPIITNGEALKIGAIYNINSMYSFNGRIKKIQIYNQVLSAGEIEGLYARGGF